MAGSSLFQDSEILKRCTRCHTAKPLSEFNKNKLGKSGLSSRCRECGRKLCRDWYERNKETERQKSRRRMRIRGPLDRQRAKEWAAANPERARYHSRKKLFRTKYNMTIEEHDALFASQGFACGACGSAGPNSKKGWSTDHCHDTGIVRGILCHHCNVGLGHAKDSVETMKKWIAYIERHK